MKMITDEQIEQIRNMSDEALDRTKGKILLAARQAALKAYRDAFGGDNYAALTAAAGQEIAEKIETGSVKSQPNLEEYQKRSAELQPKADAAAENLLFTLTQAFQLEGEQRKYALISLFSHVPLNDKATQAAARAALENLPAQKREPGKECATIEHTVVQFR